MEKNQPSSEVQTSPELQRYQGKNVLVTGGLGFIGSNLVIRLVALGAKVTVVDSMIPEYGGNLFNVAEVKEQVHINYCDLMDKNAMEHIVQDKEYIFHLAGQVSHIMSYSNPYLDIDYNITGSVILLEACRKYNPTAKIVYTGTRGQYGPAAHLPVREDAPTHPKGIFEITNLTAEKIFQVYNDTHQVPAVLTRLTNIYGPRAQMKSNKYGVANWFIRLVLDDQVIPLFGDGKIKRDFLYIDDVLDALLLLPLNPACFGEIFNVGHDQPSDFLELAQVAIELAGKGRIQFTPFSEERKKQEPGDFYSDISKIKKAIGWSPKVHLREGVGRTLDFFQKYKSHYW
jgi:UDP-glucose 4-epimerase